MEAIMFDRRSLTIILIGSTLLTACASPASSPTPQLSTATPTLFIYTESPSTPTPMVAGDICNDPQATALIDSLKSSVLTANGGILSSLVSPTRGMEVRWVRYGTAVTYTHEQAKFLYETTFEVNWGAASGSGLDKIGAFHDVIVPDLVRIFKQPYTLHCNELKHGGATYELEWLHQGDFYAVHFPGTEQNGFLDWHTWAIGIEYEGGKPYIYALMQFFWEP
jgi:hypothetical protein